MSGPHLSNHPSSSSSPQIRPATILEILRIGLGVIWALNLFFIVDPANQFFPTFAATAIAFVPSTLTGPTLPEVVAQFPLVFALIIAFTTLYLAIAFLAGTTTRWACVVGGVFSSALLVVQWGATFGIPGGTDVGPQPLYLLLYGTLYFGGAGRSLTLRTWLSSEGRSEGGTEPPHSPAVLPGEQDGATASPAGFLAPGSGLHESP